MAKNTAPKAETVEPVDAGFDDGVTSGGEARKPFALLEDESRLQLCVTALIACGEEEFKSPQDGKITKSYKIILQMTSARLRKYEDGTVAEGHYEFAPKFTFSFHEKSRLAANGFLTAVGINPSKTMGLNEFAGAILGKVISGRIKHREWEKAGQTGIAMDIEAFKSVAEPMDATELIASWKLPGYLGKKYPDKKCLSALARKNGEKAAACSTFMTKTEELT